MRCQPRLAPAGLPRLSAPRLPCLSEPCHAKRRPYQPSLGSPSLPLPILAGPGPDVTCDACRASPSAVMRRLAEPAAPNRDQQRPVPPETAAPLSILACRALRGLACARDTVRTMPCPACRASPRRTLPGRASPGRASVGHARPRRAVPAQPGLDMQNGASTRRARPSAALPCRSMPGLPRRANRCLDR